MARNAAEKKKDSYFLTPVWLTHSDLKQDYTILKLPMDPLPSVFAKEVS